MSSESPTTNIIEENLVINEAPHSTLTNEVENIPTQEPELTVPVKIDVLFTRKAMNAEEKSGVKEYFENEYERPFLYKISQEEIDSGIAQGYLDTVAKILQLRRNEFNVQPLIDAAVYSTDIPAIAEAWESAGIEQSLSGGTQKEVIIDKIIKSLHQGSLGAEDWLEILKRYDGVVQETRDWLKEKSEALKSDFVDSFIEKINPKLQSPKTPEEIKEILNDFNFTVQDPLAVEKHIGATTRTGSNHIVFSSIPIIQQAMYSESEDGKNDEEALYFKKRFLHMMSHEMLHSITSSDQILSKKTIKDADGNKKTIGSIGTDWGGLETGTKITKIQFTWLNEALTETYASSLTNLQSIEYEDERNIFKNFCVKGITPIDEQLFLDAYFERKTIEAKEKGTSHIYWKKLTEAIRQAYPHDPLFFVKFDAYYTKYGGKAALDFIENWDSNNPTKIT